MSEDPSPPFSGPNMANGTSSPHDQLRLEAARKRLKSERTTSENESPLDAQIRRLTEELEELKKQRQVAELQEQIWAEQHLLEASRNRLSVAAASASPMSNSPAPVPATATALTPASALVSAPSTSTAIAPSPQVVSHPPQPTQAVAKPSVVQNNPAVAASPNVNQPFVASQPAAVQQPQKSPLVLNGNGLTQGQAVSSASAGNGVTNATPSRPSSAVPTSLPVASKQQMQQQRQQQLKEQLQKEQQRKQQEQQEQQEQQRKQQEQQEQQQQQECPWFKRPCTPGAPADSTLRQLPPYQGRTREEYASFIAALESHFSRAPQYYSKEREYRKVKLGLQHLAPAPRASWHALTEYPETWHNFRIFLFKVVVRNLKPIDQARQANTTQPAAPKVETAQTPAAQQPPPTPSSMPKVQPGQPAQQSPQAQRNGSLSHGPPPSATPNLNAKTAVATYVNCQQSPKETVQAFSTRLQATSSFNAELSLHDRMGFLKKGVVSPIRNRAHRPFPYFKTYDEYVVYLQDIEDTLPQRQIELKGEQPPQTNASKWVPVAWNGNSNHQTTQQGPGAARGRSPDCTLKPPSNVPPQAPKAFAHSSPPRPKNGPASPTARKSMPRRMSSPAPPDPKMKPTDGRDWWACRNYIGGLEAHFKNHPRYFTDEGRKVTLARRYICPSLNEKWAAFARKRPQITWFDVCVFIINQSAQSFTPESAVSRYLRCSQMPNQKIREFALWVQQFAPHYQRPGWDELRHLYDRIMPYIKTRARKDYKDFSSLAAMVAYLEAVESTHPDRPKDIAPDNARQSVPRKRSRED